MIGLYQLKRDEINRRSFENKNESISIQVFEPRLFNISMWTIRQDFKQKLMSWYWYMVSKGRYKMYYVKDKGNIIHYSYCIPRCHKFLFMNKKDIHIGPCVTDSEYRGKGIFPTVVSKIISDHKDAKLYMIIDEDNISSQRGASKVGFEKVERLTFNRFLKTYRIKGD